MMFIAVVQGRLGGLGGSCMGGDVVACVAGAWAW